MSDIFLSYAREDIEWAKFLAHGLEKRGWSVWWDREIPPGESFDRVIEREVSASKCIVVIWSAQSIVSDWVKSEADEGKRRGKLVPVLVDHSRPPMGFRYIQAANLVDWHGDPRDENYQSFLQAVSTFIPHAKTPPSVPALPSKTRAEPTRRSVGPWVRGSALLVTAGLALVIFSFGWFLAPSSAVAPSPAVARSPAVASSPAVSQVLTPGTPETPSLEWDRTQTELSKVWGNDWPQTIQILQDFVDRNPTHDVAKQKLNDALISEGDSLLEKGDKEAATNRYSRAALLGTKDGTARAKLRELTPTPAPLPPTSTRAPVVPAAPAAAPVPRTPTTPATPATPRTPATPTTPALR